MADDVARGLGDNGRAPLINQGLPVLRQVKKWYKSTYMDAGRHFLGVEWRPGLVQGGYSSHCTVTFLPCCFP